MGCDIHLHIEVKIDGQWRHLAAPQIGRDYDLFAKMANVRNDGDITPISVPKGLPDNITFLTNYDYKKWDTDGHSHSWFGLDEIVKLDGWLNKNTMGKNFLSLEYSILHTYCFGNSFAKLKKYPEDRPKGVTDARFVFWFDN